MVNSNIHWLAGVAGLMFMNKGYSAKDIINSLLIKIMFDIYNLVVKPVQGSDIIDYLSPHLTIFEREYLSDHLYAIIFAMLVLHYGLKHSKECLLFAPLSQTSSKGEIHKIDKSKLDSLLTIASKLNISDQKSN